MRTEEEEALDESKETLTPHTVQLDTHQVRRNKKFLVIKRKVKGSMTGKKMKIVLLFILFLIKIIYTNVILIVGHLKRSTIFI